MFTLELQFKERLKETSLENRNEIQKEIIDIKFKILAEEENILKRKLISIKDDEEKFKHAEKQIDFILNDSGIDDEKIKEIKEIMSKMNMKNLKEADKDDLQEQEDEDDEFQDAYEDIEELAEEEAKEKQFLVDQINKINAQIRQIGAKKAQLRLAKVKI